MTRLLLAAALLVLPAAAWAQCRVPDGDQVMTCAEGLMWDAREGTCVPIVVG